MIVQDNVKIETEFHANGKLRCRRYLVNNEVSRDPKDGPASETFHEDGRVNLRQYLVNGKLSRDPEDGPAFEVFDENEVSKYREYWVVGRRLTRSHHEGRPSEVDAILKPKPDFEGLSVEIDGIKYKLSKV